MSKHRIEYSLSPAGIDYSVAMRVELRGSQLHPALLSRPARRRWT